MNIPPMVSPQWLRGNLDDPALGVIENAWDKQRYARDHIPGAIATPGHPHLNDFDAADAKSPNLFTAKEFQGFCRRFGLQRDRHYVDYDDWHGLFAARF
jgi:3-mercaptopyruvate sulfurtransferase SseA